MALAIAEHCSTLACDQCFSLLLDESTDISVSKYLGVVTIVSTFLGLFELEGGDAKSSEYCYMAEVLYSMYNDPQNTLYMTFLKSVLAEVQTAIEGFEGDQVDPLKLLYSLVSLIKSVSSKVLNPLANVDVLKEPTEGYISSKPYLFESKAAEFHLVPEDEKNVRKQCVAFTISLTNELRVRLPDNIEALQYISVFNVEESLKHNRSPGEIEKVAKLLGFSPEAIHKIVHQWRTIHLENEKKTHNGLLE
ncbi:KRAB domain-containing zinc finger protein [Sarotherodon galilaeus]